MHIPQGRISEGRRDGGGEGRRMGIALAPALGGVFGDA